MNLKAIVSRLVMDSQASLSATRRLQNQKLLSTAAGTAHGSLKVEKAETVQDTPPSAQKLLVLGGNGFVGSHVCKEALGHGIAVSSLSRSGRSSIQESWTDSIHWHRGDLLAPDSLYQALEGVTCVISCVGGFGSQSHMYKINGSANINAIKVAKEQGVKRFVYVSAADFGLVNYLLRGYYDGKRATETELMKNFPYEGVILRPGFIHGTRKVGSISLPLSIIGAPLEMVLKHARPLTHIPLIGPLFTAPVKVASAAKVAVRAAVDPTFPPGVLDVYAIQNYSDRS